VGATSADEDLAPAATSADELAADRENLEEDDEQLAEVAVQDPPPCRSRQSAPMRL
jgi:hypothetical protein